MDGEEQEHEQHDDDEQRQRAGLDGGVLYVNNVEKLQRGTRTVVASDGMRDGQQMQRLAAGPAFFCSARVWG